MVNIQAYWRMAPATWRSLTIGCVFLFTAGSLPFFHVGLISSFSLRSACSSKIGLMKKEASNIFQTPIGYFQNKLIRPCMKEIGCAHSKTHFVDSVIFAAAGFFSSSVFCISFPCFPAFFHCGRTASVGLWEAIRVEDTLAKPSLTGVLFVPLRGIRSCGGRTKADGLHHF